jgi:hypothetical protein
MLAKDTRGDMEKPTNVNILGIDYGVNYVDKPSDVDIFMRASLWGQVDFWTRSIRIYGKDRQDDDTFKTLLHEVIHAIVDQLHIDVIRDSEKEEEIVSLLALGLADVLTRNDWLK